LSGFLEALRLRSPDRFLGFDNFISSCGFGFIRTRAPIRRFVSSRVLDRFVMAEIPKFAVREFKLEAIARLSQEDWDFPNLKHPNLERVAESFRGNIAIVRFMMSLPTTIVGAMAQTQRSYDVAELQITGQLGGAISAEDHPKIEALAKTELQHFVDRDRGWQESGDPGWDGHVLKYHLDAAKSLSGLVETPLGAYGFVHMFSGYITGTWTAIETLLGDLWESALNSHPKILASLDGKAKGAADKIDGRGGARIDPESKKLDLNLVARHGFDLRVSMGTIFRLERRFEFTRLSSAREAYLRAFSERASRVETAIKSDSIEALSAVRNVLLHKAGVADDEYVKQQSRLKIPVAAKGEKIRLDGQNTAALIKPAFTSCKSLMIAVDDWIADN
jgi:hypothetical protein